MMLLISVAVAIGLVLGLGAAEAYLPYNHLLGGGLYQVVAIVLAIVISAVLNMPMLNMMRANSAYNKGKNKDAVMLYKKAYKSRFLSADMMIFCGYIFLKENEKALAEEVFEKVGKKKLNQRQKNSLDTNRAILFWKKGDIDGAVALLEDVWARENSVTVAGTLGALMLVKARKTGDYSSAVEFCEKTNEQYTYEKTILANLGEAYYSIGENEKALKTFGELMDCGSTAPAAYYYYGLALLKAGKREDAAEMLERASRQRFSALSTISKKAVRAKLEELTKEETEDIKDIEKTEETN